MHPVLAAPGGITLYSYGAFLLLASIAAVALAAHDARRLRGVPPARTLEVAAAALFAALCASKMALLAAEGAGSFAGLHGGVRLARSAGFLHAGLLGGLLGALVAAGRLPTAPLGLLDAVAPSAALGAAVGRLGCLAAGCCYGAETGVPWALVYSDPAAHALAGTPLGVALHPLPVYALLAELAVFAVTRALAQRETGTGLCLGGLCLLEGASRLVLEPFRGERPGLLGPVSGGQALAAVLVVVGAGLLLRRWRAQDAMAAQPAEAAR